LTASSEAGRNPLLLALTSVASEFITAPSSAQQQCGDREHERRRHHQGAKLEERPGAPAAAVPVGAML
jgi:hypothetical protein